MNLFKRFFGSRSQATPPALPTSSVEATSSAGKSNSKQAAPPRDSVGQLIAALKDEKLIVRKQAAEALGTHGDGRAVEPLISVLYDNYDVALAAAEALAQIGDQRAVEPLVERVKATRPSEPWAAALARLRKSLGIPSTTVGVTQQSSGATPSQYKSPKAAKDDTSSTAKDAPDQTVSNSASRNARLIEIDYTLSKLLRTYSQQTTPVECLNGPKGVHECLKACYGQIHAVMFLTGATVWNSVLIFEDGSGILVGKGTLLSDFTFGYGGQGSRNYSSFLKSEGFVDSDTTQFQAPLVVNRDGTKMTGVKQADRIQWADGSATSVTSLFGPSGFFLFDHNRMATSFGRQVIETICGSLRDSHGLCIFHDGDDTLGVIEEFKGKGTFRSSDDSISQILPKAANSLYVIAMWSTSVANFDVLHRELSSQKLPGYLGRLQLQGERDPLGSFSNAMWGFGLPAGIVLLDGVVSNGTSKCGTEGHDWSSDCIRCVTCGIRRITEHIWDGCKCSACAKTRDKGHDWSCDCEKCAKCGSQRIAQHSWDGCKCITCGKIRDGGGETNESPQKVPQNGDGANALPAPSLVVSSSKSAEVTSMFLWNADVMPSLYGQTAQDALSSALQVALKPRPANVLGIDARAGDLLGGTPCSTLKGLLAGTTVDTANMDVNAAAEILSGKAPKYVPYVVVINANNDSIDLAHKELFTKQSVGYLGVISIRPPIDLTTIEKRLLLPYRNLQISSGRVEAETPDLAQLLAQAEKAKDKMETVQICDQILVLAPDYSDAHNLRGWALQKLDRIDEAEEAYRRAASIDPKNPSPLWHLSHIVASHRRNYSEAVALVDRVIALKPPFLDRAIRERQHYASQAASEI